MLLASQQLKRSFGNSIVQRNSKFAQLLPDDLRVFKDIVGEAGTVTNPEDLDSHNTAWGKKFKGRSSLMLRPRTTEEVAACLKHCNERMLAVVPQAGNTNFVGGAVPVHDEVIVSTSRMDTILDFDESYGIISAEAGVVLRTLQNHAIERGYEVPLEMGAERTCQIGGNLATNPGGLKTIRYNSLHANTIGLKAVLPDGTIMDNMTTLRKDNTGYDLKHLFIGSEGTLGIITECAILCPPHASKKNVAMVCVNSFDGVLRLLHKTKQLLGNILYTYEVMDRQSMELVLAQDRARSVNPFQDRLFPFYVVIETGSRDIPQQDAEEGQQRKNDPDLDKMFQLFDYASDCIVDGVVAQDEQQFKQIWRLREQVAPAGTKLGYCRKYDLSLQPQDYYRCVEATRDTVRQADTLSQEEKDQVCTVGYGHVGDGNLHLNWSIPAAENTDLAERVTNLIDPFVMNYVRDHQGSVSAEQGIGQEMKKYLDYSKSADMIRLMRQIKGVFDPKGIMNPYKMLD